MLAQNRRKVPGASPREAQVESGMVSEQTLTCVNNITRFFGCQDAACTLTPDGTSVNIADATSTLAPDVTSVNTADATSDRTCSCYIYNVCNPALQMLHLDSRKI